MTYDPRFATLSTVPTPPPRQAAIAELERVTLTREVESDEGGMVPAGSTGTVVAIWSGGSAYEVEFSRPFCALATVPASALTRDR